MDLSSSSSSVFVSATAATTKKKGINGKKLPTMMMMHRRRRPRRLQTNKRRIFLPFLAPPLILYTALNSIIILSSRQVDCLSITTFNILASVHRSMPCPSEYVAGVGVDNELVWTDQHDWRESDKAEWWKPRAEQLAKYIADELSFSDVILLQEWWNNPEFEAIFKKHLDDKYVCVSERRPGFQWATSSNSNSKKQPREDGMACLVKRQGQLELISSTPVNTSLHGCRDKIGQIIHCKEKTGDHRDVLIGNTHLSFPGGPCPIQASRRQTYEAHIVARAISRKGRQLSYENDDNDDNGDGSSKQHLELMVGDFNSNSCDMAAKTMESSPYNFVNCMSAVAEQALSASIGGVINLGVTHRNHLGEDVSVDHIMARFIDHTSTPSPQHKNEQQKSSDNIMSKAASNNQKKNDVIEQLRRMGILTRFLDHNHHSSTTLKKEIPEKNNVRKASSDHQKDNKDIIEPLRRMGYFDSKGTRLVSCRKHDIQLEGTQIMSDHRPVTADLHWPSSSTTSTSFINNNAATAAMNHNHIHHQHHHNAQVYHHHQYYDVQNATLHPLESPWNS